MLVQEAADIAREVYLGMVVDRAIGLPVLMACAEGGVEIEEVAATQPGEDPQGARSIPTPGLQPFQARRLAYELGFTGEQAPKAEALMTALCRVFLDKDCSLAEINPLVVTPKGEVHGPGRQDDLRRQRPVPPSRHRKAARRDRGEPGRAAGRPGPA